MAEDNVIQGLEDTSTMPLVFIRIHKHTCACVQADDKRASEHAFDESSCVYTCIYTYVHVRVRWMTQEHLIQVLDESNSMDDFNMRDLFALFKWMKVSVMIQLFFKSPSENKPHHITPTCMYLSTITR
jgi:hypothetical protein